MKLPTTSMIEEAAKAERLFPRHQLEKFARQWKKSAEGKNFLARLSEARAIIVTQTAEG